MKRLQAGDPAPAFSAVDQDGKTHMGIVRSAFLVDADGSVAAAGYKISPADTVPVLKKWLA